MWIYIELLNKMMFFDNMRMQTCMLERWTGGVVVNGSPKLKILGKNKLLMINIG